jgi:pSer/pThr/pTyr-binding forkhead associated (FHA) protein
MASSESLPDGATGIPDGRPTAPPRCRLLRQVGARLEEHVFDRPSWTIGASRDNDLVLDDALVSLVHCRVHLEGDRYLITDLASTHGTFVDRVRVREAWLHQGCTVSLGATDLTFRAVDAALPIGPPEAPFKEAKERWVASFEGGYVRALLRRTGGNISHAAREADIDRKYLRKLMKKHGITADESVGQARRTG